MMRAVCRTGEIFVADAAADASDTRVACPSCDLVFELSQLPEGATAKCSRCGHTLATVHPDAFQRVAALAAAALVALLIACAFPFLNFSRAGLENTMSLPQTVLSLWNNDMPGLAVLVAGFILLIPGAVCALVLATGVALAGGPSGPSLPRQVRLVFFLQQWSMVEVFFIGVLVSLVKIVKLATVVLGVAFWAYAGFAILFIAAMTRLDRFQCWQRVDGLMER